MQNGCELDSAGRQSVDVWPLWINPARMVVPVAKGCDAHIKARRSSGKLCLSGPHGSVYGTLQGETANGPDPPRRFWTSSHPHHGGRCSPCETGWQPEWLRIFHLLSPTSSIKEINPKSGAL